MSELTPEVLDRSAVWRRALYMLLFFVVSSVVKTVIAGLALVQLVIVLVLGSANVQLLRLGSSLARYSYQLVNYLTFNSEEKPFPLSDWPDDEAETGPWFVGADLSKVAAAGVAADESAGESQSGSSHQEEDGSRY